MPSSETYSPCWLYNKPQITNCTFIFFVGRKVNFVVENSQGGRVAKLKISQAYVCLSGIKLVSEQN